MATNKTPHPYADVIKAWAEGSKVQWKHKKDDEWFDVSNPSFTRIYDWRIKPVEQAREPINYFEQFKIICKGIADGRQIQYRPIHNKTWFDDNNSNGSHNCYIFDFSILEYRVKPNILTIRYQNYLLINNNVNCWASNDIETRSEIAGNDLFVRWIGEEQAITIEVEDE